MWRLIFYKIILCLFLILPFKASNALDEYSILTAPLGHCTAPTSAQMSRAMSDALSTAFGSISLRDSWDCFQSMMGGAWDGSVGVITDGINCVAHPITCATKVSEAISKMISFFSDFVSESQRIWGSLSNLPASEQQELLCSIFGTLLPSIIAAIISGGGGSARLAAILTTLKTKVAMIASVLSRVAGLPVRLLGQLSQRTLVNMNYLAGRVNGDELVRRLSPQNLARVCR